MRPFLAIATLVALACNDVLHPALNQPFTLEIGGRAEFPAASLSIRFMDVLESRCPRTDVCDDPGNARVFLEVRLRDTAQTVALNTGSPSEVIVDAFRLRLVTLTPEPPVRRQDYVVRLEVHPH